MLVNEATKRAAAKVLKRHWDSELPVGLVHVAQRLRVDVSFAISTDGDLSDCRTSADNR